MCECSEVIEYYFIFHYHRVANLLNKFESQKKKRLVNVGLVCQALKILNRYSANYLGKF